MENQSKSEFAKNWGELIRINNWFRQQDFDLEEGLEKLKLGEKLIKKCQKRLEEIGNEFTEIEKGLVVEEKEPKTNLASKEMPF